MGRNVASVVASPDGRLLAVADGTGLSDYSGSVRVYETATGEVVKKLAGHTGYVTDLAFSKDGRRLVRVSEDQTGLVWDMTLPALGSSRTGSRAHKAGRGLGAAGEFRRPAGVHRHVGAGRRPGGDCLASAGQNSGRRTCRPTRTWTGWLGNWTMMTLDEQKHSFRRVGGDSGRRCSRWRQGQAEPRRVSGGPRPAHPVPRTV